MLDERRLRRLLDVGRSVVAELDLETLLRRVLREARDLTGARYAALGILGPEGDRLERFLTLGIDEPTRARIGAPPRGRGVLGVLTKHPSPLRLRDVRDHPRSYGFPPGHPPMTSFLGVPIRVHGASYGNLYLTDKRDAEEFDADDEETIVLLASWAGIAIANARTYRGERERRRTLERAVRALEASTEIARTLGAGADLGSILALIAERGRALVDARSALVLLRDGDELVVRALAGELDSALAQRRVPLAGSIGGEVLEARTPRRIADLAARRDFELADALTARSALMVPLSFRERAVGVLAVFDHADDGEGAADDGQLLGSFAANAAAAVAAAQAAAAEGLRRSIEASERERRRWARELHDETLQELAGLRVLLAGARRSGDIATVHRALDTALEQIDTEITGLRRLIADLRPAALDAFGVKAALESLAERVSATSGLEIDLEVDLACAADRSSRRPPPAVESALYRLVQEALTNVVKHADASAVEVAIVERDDAIELTVRDDGRGFDPDAARDGFGLLGMRERALQLDGELEIASRPGEGTTVRARIPVGRVGSPPPRDTGPATPSH